MEPNFTRGSLFKLMPCTHIHLIILGAPVCDCWKLWHIALLVVTSLIRLWMTWRYLSRNFAVSEAIETFNEIAFYAYAYATFWVILRRLNLIFDFLASNYGASLESKMRKIDLVGPLIYVTMTATTVIPIIASRDVFEEFKNFVFPSFFDSFFILTKILILFYLVSYKLWFQLSPICVVIYALGYAVLYSYKMKVLKFIQRIIEMHMTWMNKE